MNFLFVLVKDSIYDIAFTLKNMGHNVTVMEHHPFDPVDLECTAPLIPIEDALRKNSYDYVITNLYITVLSNLCQKYEVPYIAWIYDSPLISVFHESVFNPVNRIFIFDHTFYNRLRQIGIPHVYYMPLAANTDRINTFVMTDEDEAKYSCDISFVGSLYEKNAYNDLAGVLPPEVTLPMNIYLMQNLCNWHSVREWPLLPPECVSYLTDSRYSDISALTKFEMPPSMYLGIIFLCRKLAEMERITALNTLAEDFPVDLYTSGQSPHLTSLRTHPSVNYYTELGKVYYFSKINLNFTLPSIETGVPQRIFDMMAYGGFVMSNYQAEYDTLFTPGKDLVVFHDLGELKELAAYYLSHEKERITIAANGYRKVNEYYNYETQLKKIISICEENPL